MAVTVVFELPVAALQVSDKPIQGRLAESFDLVGRLAATASGLVVAFALGCMLMLGSWFVATRILASRDRSEVP